LRKGIYHANFLRKYFQIKEKYHQTNLNFSLYKPFSFSYLQGKKPEGLSSAFHLQKCYHFDLNHHIMKAALLSLPSHQANT
jgi:hypothetical protein